MCSYFHILWGRCEQAPLPHQVLTIRPRVQFHYSLPGKTIYLLSLLIDVSEGLLSGVWVTPLERLWILSHSCIDGPASSTLSRIQRSHSYLRIANKWLRGVARHSSTLEIAILVKDWRNYCDFFKGASLLTFIKEPILFTVFGIKRLLEFGSELSTWLKSQQSGGRSKEISVSSGPSWWITGQSGLHSETLS